ncbi:zinc-dependent alcohol dehydrogenase [Paenibacillus sp. MMO-177]|uniref:zinc-dependent alcohol dehydrogenase n=1 Tax=Paenibacillus sp. MMO-177 TaxID=3081289 RepID=UPI003016CE8F
MVTYIEFPECNRVTIGQETFNDSPLGAKEVIIRNEASIISAGTELARLKGIEPGTEFPVRPGYGSIGIIEAKGSEVTDFEIGDRVFYAGKHASRERFVHDQGHQWGHLFKVPSELDPVEAALGCMVEIAMTAPNMTNLRLGDTVVVYGLGIVGVLAALMYQLKGARVIGVDPLQERCEWARSLGIKEVVDVNPSSQVEKVLQLTGGEGAPFTVDAVGHVRVIENCVKTTSPMGEIILLGSPRVHVEGDLNAIMWDVHLHGKSIRGAHMYRYPVRPQRGVSMDVEWVFSTAFQLILEKKLDASRFISHVISPDQAPEIYHDLLLHPNEYKAVVMDWRSCE